MVMIFDVTSDLKWVYRVNSLLGGVIHILPYILYAALGAWPWKATDFMADEGLQPYELAGYCKRLEGMRGPWRPLCII